MGLFERELTNVLNPAYGASLLHAVIRGHSEVNEMEQGLAIPHLFVALPLLLNPRVLDALSHTRSGLRNVAEKLDNGPNTGADLLRTLLPEAKRKREFTLQSLNILLLANLVGLDLKSASVSIKLNNRALPVSDPEGYAEGLKLGKWLASLSVFEVSSITKVVY